MNANDQYFQPGDKVMRVSDAYTLGLLVSDAGVLIPGSEFGRVLCVSACWPGPRGNSVTFVGVQNTSPAGFYARCFRKVEEIKLCVRAAEKTRLPAEVVTALPEIQN